MCTQWIRKRFSNVWWHKTSSQSICLYLSVCMTASLSVHLPTFMPACLSQSFCLPGLCMYCFSDVSVSTYLLLCSSICMSPCLSVCLLSCVFLSIYLSTCLVACLSLSTFLLSYLSDCLLVYLSDCLYFYVSSGLYVCVSRFHQEGVPDLDDSAVGDRWDHLCLSVLVSHCHSREFHSEIYISVWLSSCISSRMTNTNFTLEHRSMKDSWKWDVLWCVTLQLKFV